MFEIRMKDGSTKNGNTPLTIVFKSYGLLIVSGFRYPFGISEVIPRKLIDAVYVDGIIQYESSGFGAD